MANARLVADLYANTTQFERGMKTARRATNDLASEVSSASNLMKAAFAAITTGALVLFIKRQAEVIDQTSKLSRTLGVNIADFQALSLVAEEAGVGQEQLTVAFTKTQKAIYEAAQGTKTYVDAFSQIGLKAQDLINLNPDQQFLKIAEALTNIENPTARTALALEIFGKQGRAIIDLLPDLSARIEEARGFQEKFNITLSEIDGRKVEEANDAFARIGMAIGGLGNTIAVELAPLITEVSNQLLNAGIDGEDFGRAVKRGVDYAAGSIDNLRVTILGLRALILELGLSIDLFVLDASKGFYDLAKAAREFLKPWQEAQSEAEFLFSNINQNARASADNNIKRMGDLNAEAENFKFVLGEIETIQKKADERAKAASKNSFPKLGDFDFSASGDTDEIQKIIDGLKKESAEIDLQVKLYDQKKTAIDRAKKELEIQNKITEKGLVLSQAQNEEIQTYLDNIEAQSEKYEDLEEKLKDLERASKEFGDSVTGAMSDAIVEGKNLGDVLFDLAKQLQKMLLNNLFFEPLSNSISDLFKGGLGGIGGGFGGGFGSSNLGIGIQSFLGGGTFGPGFATGTDYVPRDMNARIHRGEMIIPRSEADSIRRGNTGSSGAVYNIDARGAAPGVEQRIDNVMRQVLQLRADVPRLAVNSIDDATKRGML